MEPGSGSGKLNKRRKNGSWGFIKTISQTNDRAMGGFKDCIAEDCSAALLCPFLPDMTTIN